MMIMVPKPKFVMLKEKTGPDSDIEFTAGSVRAKGVKNYYSLHNVRVSGGSASADVRAAEGFLETR